MHSLLWPTGGAGLHAWDIVGRSALQSDMPAADCAGSDDQVFSSSTRRMIDHATQQVDVNLPAGER